MENTLSLPPVLQIMYLLSRVMQSNSCRRPGEPCLERATEYDVVHEGVLDLQQNAFMSSEWVKYERYLLLSHLLIQLLYFSVL